MAASDEGKRLEQFYSQSSDAIDSEKEPLRLLSQQIWEKPELNYEEHFAHDVLTKFLEERGFTVTRHFHLDTAFRAVFSRGTGGPNVAVLCEYDALPEIGHACGHNLIAEVGVAAGLGIKAVLEKADSDFNGTLTVLGTPAEEGGGGKIRMIEAGCFKGVSVALMAHPAMSDVLAPVCLAKNGGHVTYYGRAAHAAAAPWEGVNALDAAISAYTGLSMLRQQMKPTWRAHAIISEGGVKPNIIPERSRVSFYIRAPLDSELAVLKEKTTAVFQAAGQSAGCKTELTFDTDAVYSNMISNSTLASCCSRHWSRIGNISPLPSAVLGSTDMGNVSYQVPSIHPFFSIGTSEAIHTREFQKIANTPSAHSAARVMAKSIACIGLDVFFQEGMLSSVEKSFAMELAAAQA